MDRYLSEIQVFGFYRYAPSGWAFCNGQVMSISQNTGLFSLLGVNFGGNGTTTFSLPNLQDQVPCGVGQGAGLTARAMGDQFGTPSVTLSSTEMPMHTHLATVFNQTDKSAKHGTPAANDALVVPTSANPFTTAAAPATTFPPAMISPFVGGGQAHENRQPYLSLSFCIALSGNFPPRQ